MAATATIEWAAGGGTVFLQPLRAISEAELFARSGLTPDEAEHYAGFSPAAEQRRKEWLAVRVLAREKLGCRIGYDLSGRPFLIGREDLFVSISHTAGWAALMVSDKGRCGVDIEPVGRAAERAARRIAAPEEIMLAGCLWPENPALLVWCVKEAAYKAIGVAGIDFRNEIRLEGVSARTLQITVKMNRMSFELFFSDDLIGVCGSYEKI